MVFNDFFIGTFLKTLDNNAQKNLNNNVFLAFYFENNIDNNDFNTINLENKIKNIIKSYGLEIETEFTSNTLKNKENLYSIVSMELIEGGYLTKDNSQGHYLSSMIIAVDITLNQANFNNNYLNQMKSENLKREENIHRIKLFFDVKLDIVKKNFEVEKINFNIDNNLQLNFPLHYEEVMKIKENDFFIFYIAKKNGNNCAGDLFVVHKDINLWTLSKKNIIYSQNENSIIGDEQEYFADFHNVN